MLIKHELPILWMDFETSGLQPERHGIIQMHLLFDNMGYIEDELHLDIQPFAEDWITLNDVPDFIQWGNIDFGYESGLANKRVIQQSGITLKQIATFTPPKDAFNQLIAWLDKHINKFDTNDKVDIGGYNVQFDLDFLLVFFTKNDNKFLGSYLTWRKLDPLYMLYLQAHMRFGKADNLSSFALEAVAKHYGLLHTPHQAESDIKACRALWYILNARHTIENCLCGKKGETKWHDFWYCQDCYNVLIKERK